jgi:hypothetical protein
MKKWANKLNRAFSKEEDHMDKKHKEILNIPGHNRNSNQNHVEILLYFC